ncbi:MAG TPA: M48 family metalloprotease [Spirochaetia bacterium]
MKTLLRPAVALAVLLSLAGCSSLLSGFSPGNFFDMAVGAAAGNPSDVEKMNQAQKAVKSVQSAAEEITPEQEYYVGRAVAATVLTSYPAYDNTAVNNYLNTLGRGLALASVLPETFSGYHFLVMDTDEINAFGAPSGYILVSRGLLRCATTEDEVAAILAHEIGHVSLKHGLSAISQGRWTQAALEIGKFAAQSSDSAVLRDLTASFGDVISDIVKTMVTSGYSQELEKQADLEAIRILHDVGYEPAALVRVLKRMETRVAPGGKGFGKTHPDPEVRIEYLIAAINAQTPVSAPSAAQAAARQARWRSALGSI